MKYVTVFISTVLCVGFATLGFASAQTAPEKTASSQLTSAEVDLKLIGLLEKTFTVIERSEVKRAEFEAFVSAKQLIPDSTINNLHLVFGGMSRSWFRKLQIAQLRFGESKKTSADLLRFHVEVCLFLPSYTIACQYELRAWMNPIRDIKNNIPAAIMKEVSDLGNSAWDDNEDLGNPVKNVCMWLLSDRTEKQLDRLFAAAFTPPFDKQ